jgi:hypothetical protein
MPVLGEMIGIAGDWLSLINPARFDVVVAGWCEVAVRCSPEICRLTKARASYRDGQWSQKFREPIILAKPQGGDGDVPNYFCLKAAIHYKYFPPFLAASTRPQPL